LKCFLVHKFLRVEFLLQSNNEPNFPRRQLNLRYSSSVAEPPQPQPAKETQSAHKNLSAISRTSKLPQFSQAGVVEPLNG
jgi:hypothetical protein